MTDQATRPRIEKMDGLATAAATIGHEVVDIAGVLDLVEEQALGQSAALGTLEQRARQIVDANSAVRDSADALRQNTAAVTQDVTTSGQLVRDLGAQSREVAGWVHALCERSDEVGSTLKAVKNNNSQIAAIAMQVNTLAINAKIEAARAGESGKGFAVVAEAINELSQKTRSAAEQISANIEALTSWIGTLGVEARDVADIASDVMTQSDATDQALNRTEIAITSTGRQAERIAEEAARVSAAVEDFVPNFSQISAGITETSKGIEQAHGRVLRLIDTSEEMVQSTAALGGMTEDARFIEHVQRVAAQISDTLEQALSNGRLSEARLFDRTYEPVPGTTPQQVRTGYVDLFDQLLPPIQEPVLAFDPKVVFCAAVDVNGYLPTHNRKFSQPQTDDAVWNTAHCRNRRIFDDRVGLKAGRSTAPFLLQVYRRDMGGGDFKMMKDLSCPIRVNGKHWGGLRLAYTF
ncbi:methyl-accepting chemotaxis protein [uncultured Tateyamaria sp.]|uniref:methyl-accepting chemotaxis protein n=1 Tax=Tateyamaria sp. 1078 TaxID=3417464 RepID=UPI00262467A7|nr:methyl-accepting chemotaxis protein [uncultured Tateyamaria sp.]